MTGVTNGSMDEILRKPQSRQEGSEHMIVELHSGQNAIRGYIASMQSDMTSACSILTRIDQRLDRIERRLEWREMAEAGSTCDPSK